MELQSQIIWLNAVYKYLCLAMGFGSIYLGYHLFLKGIWGNSGDLETSFKDNKLVLKSAAPGTFFALFGALIISITIWKGMEVTSDVKFNDQDLNSNNSTEQIEPLPDEPPIK